MSTVEQANGLTDLLVRQPLAGFLALTLIALAAMFLLLLREVRAHNATLREVVALTSAISKQWDSQIQLMAKLSTILDRMTSRPKRRSPSQGDLPKVSEADQ
jgi:hypothetical protein